MPAELCLGIESSCDETAAAVVADGHRVLSSIVHSQAAEHAPYGGVVPEIAGRSHLARILPVIDAALDEAGVGLDDLSLVAVTAKPGLIGSLLVGLSAAKSIAWARGLPLVGVDHVEAHAHAATMEVEESEPVRFPALALVVSGGHTALWSMDGPTRMRKCAETLDDAAGEAFDKVAWLLGLEYPGGPAVSALAREGDPRAVAFPRYRPRDRRPGFSFSGLKTAVLYHLRGQDALAPTPAPEDIEDRAGVAASFQEAVVDDLVGPTLQMAREEGYETVLVSGGVACNARLRERMSAAAAEAGIRSLFPSPAYCSDNGAMIGGLGWHLWRERGADGLDLDARAR